MPDFRENNAQIRKKLAERCPYFPSITSCTLDNFVGVAEMDTSTKEGFGLQVLVGLWNMGSIVYSRKTVTNAPTQMSRLAGQVQHITDF